MSRPFRDVETIVRHGIEADGGDGLYNPDVGCACLKDALAPCGEVKMTCRSGVKLPCPPEEFYEEWLAEWGEPFGVPLCPGRCSFHIAAFGEWDPSEDPGRKQGSRE